jgi:hypothetical protein
MKRLLLGLSVVAMTLAMAPMAFAGSGCDQGANPGRHDNTQTAPQANDGKGQGPNTTGQGGDAAQGLNRGSTSGGN